MSKSALITGISGQDGAYLSKLLLSKGYTVFGTTRNHDEQHLWRLEQLGVRHDVEVINCDATDSFHVFDVVSRIKPDEIYNLSAQSSVQLSFREPSTTFASNLNAVINLLESVRLLTPGTKFYQASSSEIFGNSSTLPIIETTRFNPLSPYAVAKAAAHWTTKNYRDAFGLFAATGIMFNHESILRGKQFFIKKVIVQAAEIFGGKRKKLVVGNLDLYRDFGSSERYVEAMWLILNAKVPDDFVICSNVALSLREILCYILEAFQLDFDVVEVNEKYFRPTEITNIYGSSAKACERLGWRYDESFFREIDKMISYEKSI